MNSLSYNPHTVQKMYYINIDIQTRLTMFVICYALEKTCTLILLKPVICFPFLTFRVCISPVSKFIKNRLVWTKRFWWVPVHVKPSPRKPCSHTHVNDPSVLPQVACWPQLSVFSLHSLISKNLKNSCLVDKVSNLQYLSTEALIIFYIHYFTNYCWTSSRRVLLDTLGYSHKSSLEL